ncbi:MAG TPA: MFS transporter [Vicinamibacterales bacterium]|nr:MFS transporter [Vicinamibacterales bacterium]
MATAAPVAASRELGWRQWVPCLGMALCSWLAFVDRQVIAVLSPTILKDTGLSAQDFGVVVSFFFYAYTIANPFWGSVLDYVGLRAGMLIAVAIWTAASMSHAWMAGFAGFAVARAVLGLGEGATFPGGLRTAVESLPSDRRARGIATSFSGGTIGAILTPLIVVPIALKFGWRAAFIFTGGLGILWLLLWTAIARPPFLPARTQKPAKMAWPNPFERRFWALVASYALPALAPGPILTLVPIYLSRGMGLSQADLGRVLWMPPLAWGVGYFFWGWAADRYAAENRRPVGMFVLLTVFALAFGFTTWTTSIAIAIGIISWAAFIGGGFQMVALKVGSYAYPREQAAMMSGIASGSWSLANALLSPQIGRLFDEKLWSQAFWLIAILPAVGIAAWWVLSTPAEAQA